MSIWRTLRPWGFPPLKQVSVVHLWFIISLCTLQVANRYNFHQSNKIAIYRLALLIQSMNLGSRKDEPALQEVRPALQEGLPPQATGVHRSRSVRSALRCAEGIPEGVSWSRQLASQRRKDKGFENKRMKISYLNSATPIKELTSGITRVANRYNFKFWILNL